MNVVAIRCEACGGSGRAVIATALEGTDCPYPIIGKCSVCNGTGTERPPTNHDRDARRKIEGVTEDEDL